MTWQRGWDDVATELSSIGRKVRKHPVKNDDQGMDLWIALLWLRMYLPGHRVAIAVVWRLAFLRLTPRNVCCRRFRHHRD